jgi:type VI secretion system protein ImpF
MTGINERERLQPSLLDRLTDLEPQQASEPSDRRVIPDARLRDHVRRDLATLLGTTNLRTLYASIDTYPEIARSTINFGVPGYVGILAAGADAVALERAIRKAIVDFEPRLRSGSVKVQARLDRTRMSRGALSLQIDAEMWTRTGPRPLCLESVVDLETGSAAVTERSNR